MSRCEPGALDLDLDDEVPRDALADCLESGWTAAEIAEELGLEGADDVARWCAYHDLPLPRVAQSLPPPAAPAVEVKKEPRRRVSKAAATPPTVPAAPLTAEERRARQNARRREQHAATKAARDIARMKRDAEIIKLYGEGKGSPTISKTLKIKERTVLDALERHNVPRRDGSKAERDAVILAQHQRGLTRDEIAKTHKMTSEAVRRVLKAAGIDTSKQPAKPADLIARVAVWAMRGAGADVAQIRRLMRLSAKQIAAILETP